MTDATHKGGSIYQNRDQSRRNATSTCQSNAGKSTVPVLGSQGSWPLLFTVSWLEVLILETKALYQDSIVQFNMLNSSVSRQDCSYSVTDLVILHKWNHAYIQLTHSSHRSFRAYVSPAYLSNAAKQ